MQHGGRRVAVRYLVLLARPNALDHDRLGIIASRRLGNAVQRGRAKRRIRARFRLQEPDTTKARGDVALDLVVIPRRELVDAPHTALAAEFTAALQKVRRAHAV